MVYAYIHCKPDGTPFYVGKGVRARYKNFKYRNVYHKRVVAKYGEQNILIGKLECTTNEAALQLEVGLIKCLKRMGVKLTNLTQGGEGTVGWKCPDSVKKAVALANTKRVLTMEQRQRLGDSMRGKKRPEHAALLASRNVWTGANNPWFGKGYKQLGRKNISAKAVIGDHPDMGSKRWDTLTEVARDLQVSISAVSQAIRKSQCSKGWKLRYANDV